MSSPKNRISTFGLELEGGWDLAPRGLKHDGSVVGISAPHRGEVASPVIKTLAESEQWLRDNYPQEVNSSCGFHVHVGLAPLHYMRLMCEEFNSKFLVSMEDFWNRYRGASAFDLFRQRLDGQNAYCQKVFRPEQQLWRMEAYGDRSTAARYSQLNFCFGRHGTLECRLFPCFPSVSHSIEGMRAFANSINEFLATCAPARPIHFAVHMEEETVGRPVMSVETSV